MTDRQMILDAVRGLPETATLAEISEHIAIMASIRRAEEDSRAGRYITHEEMRKRVASWSCKGKTDD